MKNYRPDGRRMGLSRSQIVLGYVGCALSGFMGVVFLILCIVFRAPPAESGVLAGILFCGAWLCWEKCADRGDEPNDPRCEVDYHLRPLVESWIISDGRIPLPDAEGFGDPINGIWAAHIEAAFEFKRRYASGELLRMLDEARKAGETRGGRW